MFFLLLCSIIIGITLGPVKISLKELFLDQNSEILRLRIARVILGLFAGAGLAVAGTLFQAILRKPLAEPYVLGVSGAAPRW